MPRKNFYIKDADLEIFEKAEALGEDNLSAVIVEAVRQYVERKEAETHGMQEHTLEVGRWTLKDEDTRKIKFSGRQLASGRQYTGKTSDRRDAGTDWEIYQTAKGKVVIFWLSWTLFSDGENRADYVVKEDLPELDECLLGELDLLEAERVPGNLLAEAEEALGKEIVVRID